MLRGLRTLGAPAPAPVLEPSAYLTDGSRLFRVVSGFTDPQDSYATLEDCATLEIESYSPDELWNLRLRHVRP